MCVLVGQWVWVCFLDGTGYVWVFACALPVSSGHVYVCGGPCLARPVWFHMGGQKKATYPSSLRSDPDRNVFLDKL